MGSGQNIESSPFPTLSTTPSTPSTTVPTALSTADSTAAASSAIPNSSRQLSHAAGKFSIVLKAAARQAASAMALAPCWAAADAQVTTLGARAATHPTISQDDLMNVWPVGTAKVDVVAARRAKRVRVNCIPVQS